MSWDVNWTRALVTVLAAAAGAIIAGIVNAYAANRKIREIELQYLFKRRDSYIDNARSVMAAREIHLMLAERYADEAWTLAEETPGCAPIPSAVWASVAPRLRARTSAATDPVERR
jgi:hypothetical protein